MKTLGVEDGVKPIVELSINSVVGLLNLDTMKLKGKINGEVVIVLIDCGAKHNFISKKLVSLLKLPMEETSNYGVKLGSGTTTKGKEICKKVELMIGKWKMVDSFVPQEVDAILGMQWLHSLGVTEMDQSNLTMTSHKGGCKVVSTGVPSLNKARVSLKV